MNPTAPTSTITAVPPTPSGCARLVKELGADVGFAFDGDADRVIAADERGKLVDGDQMMALLAVFMKNMNMLPTQYSWSLPS